MNKIPTFKFPYDSLEETSLFENNLSGLKNSQEKAHGLYFSL